MADRTNNGEEAVSSRPLQGQGLQIPNFFLQLGSPRARPSTFLCFSLFSLFLILLCAGCGGEKPRANGRDFSTTNRVYALLGEGQQEHGNGIEHIHWEKDGLTNPTNLDGVPCRHLNLETGSMGYLYFTIDPSFKKRNVKNVKIEVEYFDAADGTFGVQYDGRKEVHQRCAQETSLRGSLNWLTATFTIEDANFRNRENSKADFRLWVGPAEFYVRRVVVTRN